MKFSRLAIALAGWLCPAMVLGAADLAINGNPYAPIVTRNIFGLIPIPTNPPVDVNANATPPPKITANGIMTIFGNKEALFKVAVPPKPGQPAGDQSYVLSEGESQDDIAVVKIDDQADVITFNNHGSIQVLPLAVAGNISTGASSPGGSGVPLPNVGGAGRFPRPFGGAGFGGRRVPSPAQANGGEPNNPGATPSYGGSPSSGGSQMGENPVDAGDGLSPEARALVIEQNYLNAKAKNDPAAVLFPPTPLRGQSDGDTGGGGEPPAP